MFTFFAQDRKKKYQMLRKTKLDLKVGASRERWIRVSHSAGDRKAEQLAEAWQQTEEHVYESSDHIHTAHCHYQGQEDRMWILHEHCSWTSAIDKYWIFADKAQALSELRKMVIGYKDSIDYDYYEELDRLESEEKEKKEKKEEKNELDNAKRQQYLFDNLISSLTDNTTIQLEKDNFLILAEVYNGFARRP